MSLRLLDWFCGAGGSSQGATAVPGVTLVHAANHWQRAIESHAANFPAADHWRGDIRDIDVATLPTADLAWMSPECTNWSRAKGKTADYAVLDLALPGMEDPAPPEEVERSRALMEEVPAYLRAMALRGRPVLAGVVENVVDIHEWVHFGRWRREIEDVGYRSRLIALNSMHAESRVTPRAPQSRDRLYLAYWHVSLGRDPDWDKWLRPTAWCEPCGEWVEAVQTWKRPGAVMGRYRQQYVYRCPRTSCRNAVVEPRFRPAHEAIDWTIRGTRIGDRAKPLAPKTIARIEAGIRRFAAPVVIEAGGHQYDAAAPKHPQHGNPAGYMRAWPTMDPLRTLHTTLTKGVAVPPFLVPVEGRDGKQPTPIAAPLRTQSTRNETGMLVPPFIAELRGGGSEARRVVEPLATFAASGTHHGLVVPPGFVMRNNGSKGDGGEHCTSLEDALRTLTTAGHQSLVTWHALYAYDASAFRGLLDALPTQPTREGDALITGQGLPAVDDCEFRMLEPDEILRGMAFADDYIVLGNRRERVAQAGNAVTPPAAEVLMSALVECVTGEALERAA